MLFGHLVKCIFGPEQATEVVPALADHAQVQVSEPIATRSPSRSCRRRLSPTTTACLATGPSWPSTPACDSRLAGRPKERTTCPSHCQRGHGATGGPTRSRPSI